MIPSLFTLRPENDSYIHSEHLSMHERVQISMFKMWNNFNVTKKSDFAIISNNNWGVDYYVDNTKKFNTPTINTYMSPEDYIKFIESFDEYINLIPEKVETEKEYPVGKLDFNGSIIKIYFVKESNWDIALKHWEERKKLLPLNT